MNPALGHYGLIGLAVFMFAYALGVVAPQTKFLAIAVAVIEGILILLAK